MYTPCITTVVDFVFGTVVEFVADAFLKIVPQHVKRSRSYTKHHICIRHDWYMHTMCTVKENILNVKKMNIKKNEEKLIFDNYYIV